MKNLFRFSVPGLPIFVLLWGAQIVGAETDRYATFELKNDVTVQVPEEAKKVRVWSALPQDDPAQEVRGLKVDTPYPYRIELDSEGSKVLYVEADAPKQKEFKIVTTFVIKRLEVHSGVDAKKATPISEADRVRFARYLQPNKHVTIDGDIRKMALEITGNEQNPVLAARKLYDWLLENIEYWVKDPKNKKASAVGSTTYCLTTRTGNCADFQSLWTSFARSIGIPTQIVYGSFLKPELMGEDQDQSYHCWAEFYAPGLGWIPHDVAVADLYAGDFPITPDNEKLIRLTTADGSYGPNLGKVNYYFGNLDERRVLWSRNRDLVFNPRQDGEPVNALPKAYVEVDGKEVPEGKGWVRKLTFRQDYENSTLP